MPFRGSIPAQMFAAESHASYGPASLFGYWNRPPDWARPSTGCSPPILPCARKTCLRAQDLVNASYYARAHALEIETQIRENEAA